jgi:hypothetical protein
MEPNGEVVCSAVGQSASGPILASGRLYIKILNTVSDPAISHRIDSVLYKPLPSRAMGHFRRRCCCPLSTGGVYGN